MCILRYDRESEAGFARGDLNMRLEDYFDFVSTDEIRLRGTRIGVEAILSEYLDGALPEEIAVNYPPLTLEQVHAAITYYLSHCTDMDQYLARWEERGDDSLRRQRKNGSAVIDRLVEARRSRTHP
jgi:uncharacterized protein (DUF433 family)